jgi:hypothetical protein
MIFTVGSPYHFHCSLAVIGLKRSTVVNDGSHVCVQFDAQFDYGNSAWRNTGRLNDFDDVMEDASAFGK